MIEVERTFDVDRPVEVVVDYLKDFANAEEWDPGTQSCTDDITVAAAAGGGSTITYHASIAFHGLAQLASPFLAGEFERLGDETEDSMIAAIDRLP